MENQLIKVSQELAKQNITEQVIAKLKENLTLKINGIEDIEGYDKVKKARLQCRDTRVLAQKICKKGREDAIAEQKLWISKEKEVIAKISEVEDYLSGQEKAIDNEKERIKIDAIKTKQLPERKQWLEAIGMTLSDEDIKKFDDVQFMQFIQEKKAEQLAEKEAKLKEQEELIRKQQDDLARKEEIENVKKEAAEKARIDYEIKLRQEEEKKKQDELRKKIENENLEKSKTDVQKIKDFIQTLSEITYPEVEDAKMKEYVDVLKTSINRAIDFVTKKIS